MWLLLNARRVMLKLCSGFSKERKHPHFKHVKVKSFYFLTKQQIPCLMEADCIHSGELL